MTNNNYCNYHLLLTEGVTPTSSRQIRASTEKTVIEYLVTKKSFGNTNEKKFREHTDKTKNVNKGDRRVQEGVKARRVQREVVGRN